MKIVIVNKHPLDTIGGSEIQCDLIGEELFCRGHEVIYITPGGQHDEYESRYRVLKSENNWNSISSIVLDENPDLVYWRFNKKNFYLSAKTISNNGIPIIFTISHVNDTLPWATKNRPKGFKSAIYLLYKAMRNRVNYVGFKYIDAVVSVNKELLHNLPVQKQFYVPSAVKNTIKDFEWDKPFVLWVSNIKEQKRPEIYYKLSESFCDFGVDFLMVGNIQSNSYQWLNSDNLKGDNFYYLGERSYEEINGMLQKSLFLIHTCKPEGFPNVFLQAWSQGKPTISYGFDPGNVIKECNLGLVCNSKFQKLIDGTTKYIEDSKYRKLHGSNALSYVKSNHSINVTVDKLENIMAELV